MKVFEPDAGTWLKSAVEDAIALAKKSDDDVRMVFNGIELIMHVASTVQAVLVQIMINSARLALKHIAIPQREFSKLSTRKNILRNCRKSMMN